MEFLHLCENRERSTVSQQHNTMFVVGQSTKDLGDCRVHLFGTLEHKFEQCENRERLIESEMVQLLDALDDRFQRSGASHLSLDVFDTLLLRNNKCEARRFLEISDALSLKCRADITGWEVYVARNLATLMSYRTREPVKDCREGHIDHILQIQKRMLNCDSIATSTMKSHEVEYEVSNLRVNALLLEFANRVKLRGGKIVLLSDMYLDAETIGQIVKRVTKEKSLFEIVFSSADYVVSKRSGLIFAEVEQTLSCASEQFFHVGDSRIGDFKLPVQNGWHAIHLPVSRQERLERLEDLDRFRNETSHRGNHALKWAKL